MNRSEELEQESVVGHSVDDSRHGEHGSKQTGETETMNCIKTVFIKAKLFFYNGGPNDLTESSPPSSLV